MHQPLVNSSGTPGMGLGLMLLPTAKHTGQEPGGELCGNFPILIVSAVKICKTMSANCFSFWGLCPWMLLGDDPLGCSPQMKVPGGATGYFNVKRHQQQTKPRWTSEERPVDVVVSGPGANAASRFCFFLLACSACFSCHDTNSRKFLLHSTEWTDC